MSFPAVSNTAIHKNPPTRSSTKTQNLLRLKSLISRLQLESVPVDHPDNLYFIPEEVEAIIKEVDAWYDCGQTTIKPSDRTTLFGCPQRKTRDAWNKGPVLRRGCDRRRKTRQSLRS